MSTKRETVETWFERVWHNKERAVIREMFVPDNATTTQTASGLRKEEALGPEEFEVFHEMMLGLVTDVNIEITNYIDHGDWTIVECTLKARCIKRQNVDTYMDGCIVLRISDGKIREARNYFDFLHFFERLDLLPNEALAKCLSGQSIRADFNENSNYA